MSGLKILPIINQMDFLPSWHVYSQWSHLDWDSPWLPKTSGICWSIFRQTDVPRAYIMPTELFPELLSQSSWNDGFHETMSCTFCRWTAITLGTNGPRWCSLLHRIRQRFSMCPLSGGYEAICRAITEASAKNLAIDAGVFAQFRTRINTTTTDLGRRIWTWSIR